MTGWRMSTHAVERILDMALAPEEVRRAIEKPSDVRPDPRGTELRTAGRITVVVAPAQHVVVTVMWRYESQRKSDVNRGADYGRDAVHAGRQERREEWRHRHTRAGRQFDGTRANRRRRHDEWSDQ